MELLIAISIIALLAGILLPVVQQSRAKGRRQVCASNLRQNITAVRMYIQDNDDDWPSYETWRNWRYHSDANLMCPDLLHSGAPPEGGIPGYAMNSILTDGTEWFRSRSTGKVTTVHRDARPDASVPFPSSTVALVEAVRDRITAVCYDPYLNTSPYPYGQEEAWKRHQGGCNYAFCDGHVKWYKSGAVGCQMEINDGSRPTFRLTETISMNPLP